MNFSRWEHLGVNVRGVGPNCMDWRHVRMVNAVLECERPKSVVEIGCFKGFSTSAIIEAHENEPFERVDLIDIDLRPELMAITPKEFNLIDQPSDRYTGKPECWIIDGDHQDAAHRDYAAAKEANAKIIVIHDTALPDQNQGAVAIGHKCRAEAVYWFEDRKERKDEETNRGLMVGFFYNPKLETIAALEALAE